MQSEMEELILDWFETIEEVALMESEITMLKEVAESFANIQEQALANGILPEDFDEWLRADVLENWALLMEDTDEDANAVHAFYTFVKEGEDRLYFQMLKRCMQIAEQSA